MSGFFIAVALSFGLVAHGFLAFMAFGSWCEHSPHEPGAPFWQVLWLAATTIVYAIAWVTGVWWAYAACWAVFVALLVLLRKKDADLIA